MTEQDSPVKRRSRQRRSRRSLDIDGLPPRWSGDTERAEAGDIDFEANAHVLANTCRWGGRTRRFLSLAQHAVTASEEVAARDGIAEEDRRALALHALLTNARAAWLGDETGALPPLRRTVRPLAPEAAAKRWLARFRELAGSSPADTGNVHAGSGMTGTAPASVAAEASS